MKTERCPRCGCNGVETHRLEGEAGRDLVRRVCMYCNHRWGVRTRRAGSTVVARVVYTFRSKVPCPECGARALKTSTRDQIRYMKCPSCQHTFKEVGEAVEARGAHEQAKESRSRPA